MTRLLRGVPKLLQKFQRISMICILFSFFFFLEGTISIEGNSSICHSLTLMYILQYFILRVKETIYVISFKLRSMRILNNVMFSFFFFLKYSEISGRRKEKFREHITEGVLACIRNAEGTNSFWETMRRFAWGWYKGRVASPWQPSAPLMNRLGARHIGTPVKRDSWLPRKLGPP